jgi:polar amino acid transport system substrate-binding protein
MPSRHVTARNFVGWIVAVTVALAAAAHAQSADKPLVVGTRIFPPFVMKQADGAYTGISMELWKRVAQKLDVTYVVKEASAPELLEPETHAVDVVVSLPITAINGRNMDLTHAFYSTGLAIATRVESTNALVTVFGKLASPTFLEWAGVVVIALVGVGVVVWLFGRRKRDSEFAGPAVHGISHGVLWAFESVAGKADAITRRRGGRLLTLLWTFVCILIVSIITAELTTALTVSQLSSKVSSLDDLPKVRVGSVKDSVGKKYLDLRQIRSIEYPDLPAAMAALGKGELDAVVNEAPLLQYQVNHATVGGMIVLPGTFHNHGYGFGLNRAHHDLLAPMNAALLGATESDDWSQLLTQYLGAHD